MERRLCEEKPVSLETIRRQYGVPAKRHASVRYRGDLYYIVGAKRGTPYLRISPMSGGRILTIHPTDDDMEYINANR